MGNASNRLKQAIQATLDAYNDELDRDDDARGSIVPTGDDFNDLCRYIEHVLKTGMVPPIRIDCEDR